MLNLLQNYLVPDTVYMWTNLGVLPLWLMLFFIPNFKITRILINSIIIPLILATAYFYIFYEGMINKEISLKEIFDLYNGLDDLYIIFSNEIFLIIFWLHFLSLNLFLGSWISFDAVRFGISKGIVFFPLILVYFTGPAGLVVYWLIRIPYAKKISLHD